MTVENILAGTHPDGSELFPGVISTKRLAPMERLPFQDLRTSDIVIVQALSAKDELVSTFTLIPTSDAPQEFVFQTDDESFAFFNLEKGGIVVIQNGDIVAPIANGDLVAPLDHRHELGKGFFPPPISKHDMSFQRVVEGEVKEGTFAAHQISGVEVAQTI
jgi:hypothetical protein